VVSVSPGSIGGMGASHHLRQVVSCVNIPLLAQPESYIGNVESLLDEAGNVANERTKTSLQKYANAFSQWVSRF
jgi:chromate reductase